ncbi:MAG: nucleotidyltransferase domain-containing protein, partial [Candidatus Woesearchaeota archaeon]|nr:nucleotidyltransferase domain-containing protein [Candidatus Woesearchaeota archaeon]
MLKLFNNLHLFFEDVFIEISVRAYAIQTRVSPPTASKILKSLTAQELLIEHRKGIYIYYRANREHYVFQQLARAYWYTLLNSATEQLHNTIAFRTITLFGSLASAENTAESDIDLYVDVESRNIDLSSFQKKFKRPVQLHFKNSLKNPHLKKNIEKGIRIR